MATLEDQLAELRAKIEAVENKPANNITAEQIGEALEGHPLLAEFRAFLDKWGK